MIVVLYMQLKISFFDTGTVQWLKQYLPVLNMFISYAYFSGKQTL